MENVLKKFAIVLKAGLPSGKAINLASHLSAQLGTLVPDIGGEEVRDASGVAHSGVPIWPNVILSASPEALAHLVVAARRAAEMDQILFLDFPEQGFTTKTDDEYRTEVGARAASDIVVEGCLLFGTRQRVNALTKGLVFWA